MPKTELGEDDDQTCRFFKKVDAKFNNFLANVEK